MSVSQRTHQYLLGIVGKPNTGKSTFFSAATLAPAEIANYPFTTIKPNRGIGYVRAPCVCKEFNVKDNPKNSLCVNGIRLIPVELIDCAGLVPGAWQGRGLGNQFLDEIRRADALVHVIDASGGTDIEGRLVKLGSHDPTEDACFLETEITMWLVQILKKDWLKIARTAESSGSDLIAMLEAQLSGLAIKRTHIVEAVKKAGLNEDKPTKWSEDDLVKFLNEIRKIAKPMLIAANKIDCPTTEGNIERLKQLNYNVIPTCAEAELVLRRAAEKGIVDYKPGDCNFSVLKPGELTEGQSRALKIVQENVLLKFGTTGVQETINTAYFELLNMIVVYPVEDVEHLSDHQGRILPDAYLVPYGTTARQLAYIIHTELGEGFIYAMEAREKKRIGENHILKNGDVVSIVSAKKRG